MSVDGADLNERRGRAENLLQEGATFHLPSRYRLSLHRMGISDCETGRKGWAPAQSTGAGMQVAIVLVAEDDESIVDLLTQSLEDGGFAVIAAPSGGAAVAAISAAEDLQALVTDVRMGSGPDGWEVAHFARHRFPDVAVIYISGDSAQEWTEKGVPRSIMIEKPFAPAQVVTGISTLLNKTD